MKRQSVGVVPFKHLIKWCYPKAVKAFDPCAAVHDSQYKSVDWLKGDEATAKIDDEFLSCCLEAADYNPELEDDAYTFWRVCRAWGIMRARLWKIGIRY